MHLPQQQVHILYFLIQKNDLNKNQRIGTSKDGSIFNVLQSLIFRMESPELSIRKPPTTEISVNNSEVKNPDKYPEKR